jgi:Leucine-rich repeat (LRR) protein
LFGNDIQLNENTFEGLLSLETLDLSNNKIEHLNTGTLKTLKKLKKLDLSANNIIKIGIIFIIFVK